MTTAAADTGTDTGTDTAEDIGTDTAADIAVDTGRDTGVTAGRLCAVILAMDDVTPDLLSGGPGETGGGGLDRDLQFGDDLGFDSVMLMQLKYGLEKGFPELGALCLPELLPSLATVGTLIDYLSRRLAPAGRA
ncbi:hypothetical protein [Kitasatospora sp. MAP5-34]|uniref:acyl carrier protein n=1 Tax=Kitasatospora sp. MAP5-34 TaxID=3035102 RepID=UPI002474C9E2|nr:hypothetical protein [Kitasatospora sp. MAP5-34]MDH6579756.1 acyl carrier protein [Kitasatospora sp. MAP5-34]